MSTKDQADQRALTGKQAAFVEWYCSAVVNMNGVDAARRAGYSGNPRTLAAISVQNLGLPHIQAAIDRKMKVALSGAQVTVEAVLRRLQVAGDQALEDKQYGAAVRAAELLGKYLKLFTDRIEHVTSIEDIPTVELERILRDTVRANGIDILSILAGDESGDSGGDDSEGAHTTH